MKKCIFLIIQFVLLQFNWAQTGINIHQPDASLHISEIREDNSVISSLHDGLLIPRLSKLELASKTVSTYNETLNGTLVFVDNIQNVGSTLPSYHQVLEILQEGFYYFSGTKNRWVSTIGDISNDAWSNNKYANFLELKGTSNGQNRNNNSNVIISDNGFLGINTLYLSENEELIDLQPQKRLDIDAAVNGNANDYIKLKNLKEIDANVNSSTLVIDQEGNIYKNDVENLSGQIMRIPISGFTLGTSGTTSQGSIRLDFNLSSISAACVQGVIKVCNSNFINTIKGVRDTDLVSNVTLAGSTGTIPRITDRIKLPKGVYKVQIRLNGYYDNMNEANGNTIIKLAVGNKEYSVHNYYDRLNGVNAKTSIIFTDYINLNQDDFIDFLMDNWNLKTFVLPYEQGEIITNPFYDNNLPISTTNPINLIKRNVQSMVLIERLR